MLVLGARVRRYVAILVKEVTLDSAGTCCGLVDSI